VLCAIANILLDLRHRQFRRLYVSQFRDDDRFDLQAAIYACATVVIKKQAKQISNANSMRCQGFARCQLPLSPVQIRQSLVSVFAIAGLVQQAGTEV
jgi:hypothetical protein